jgi:hypothetical protein
VALGKLSSLQQRILVARSATMQTAGAIRIDLPDTI